MDKEVSKLLGFDEIKSIVTHGAKFHADEVACVALLRIFNISVPVIRQFDLKDVDMSTSLTLDMVGAHYDHHMVDKKCRPNGDKVPYSTFGLLWEKLGHLMLNDKWRQEFDKTFVEPICAVDNFGPTAAQNTLSLIIASMNPSHGSDEKASDDMFKVAVTFMELSMTYVIDKYIMNQDEEEKAAESFSSRAKENYPDNLWVMEDGEFYSTQVCVDLPVDVTVSVSNRGGYQVLSVNHPDRLVKLIDADGYDGLKFQHTGRFIATFDTKDNAITFAIDSAKSVASL